MCGIAGIIGRVGNDSGTANRAALARMNAALSHRGPDAHGSWESDADASGQGVMLTHRRLAILDLDPRANQPMVDLKSQQVIAFNGEIYNFKSVRARLEARGETFASTGDTAVLLRSLALDGTAALADLRGMFAFAQFDPLTRTLFLARDPLGIKPLYVAINSDVETSSEWSLVFASEIRAILASGLIQRPTLCRHAVGRFIWNGFVTGPGTIVSQIRSLLSGEILSVRDRTVISTSIGVRPASERCVGSINQLRERLQESIDLHLLADVPVGVFLSGGVDSSAVANLASKTSVSRINTFTLTFDELEFSEKTYAAQVARAIGSEHHEINLSEKRFVGEIDAAIDALDQPTFDAVNSFFISKAVREAGLTVALVGTGGDELFGGYQSFARLPKLLRAARLTRLVPANAKYKVADLIARLGKAKSSHVAPQTRWAKLPDFLSAGDDVLDLYQLAYAMFRPNFVVDLLEPIGASPHDHFGLSVEMQKRLRKEIEGLSDLAAISVLERRLFLGERLLRDTDVASMAVALETRLPLVDIAVNAAASGLLDDVRFSPVGRKQALRDAGLVGLDPNIFDRPKSGFVLPFDRWIRQALAPDIERTLGDAEQVRAVGLQPKAVWALWQAFKSKQPGLYWSRIWSIYILLRWARKHGLRVA